MTDPTIHGRYRLASASKLVDAMAERLTLIKDQDGLTDAELAKLQAALSEALEDDEVTEDEWADMCGLLEESGRAIDARRSAKLRSVK